MPRLALIISFLLLCLPSHSEEIPTYRLGPGDLVQVIVYDEPDLSLEVRIGLSGKISYPLLGDVTVQGLSPDALEDRITQGLKGPYLVDPSVTVTILEYRPFYVTGEVKKPGSYAFYPGMTVDRAISIAGGFTDRASRDKIFVEHDQSLLKLGDSADSDKKDTLIRLSDRVLPGDVITVKQSFF